MPLPIELLSDKEALVAGLDAMATGLSDTLTQVQQLGRSVTDGDTRRELGVSLLEVFCCDLDYFDDERADCRN